jgi:hypothetical protein
MLNQLNIRTTLRLLLAILAGVILALVLQEKDWLLVSFLATVGIVPYGTSHTNGRAAFMSLTLIFMAALFFSSFVVDEKIVFMVFMCILAIIIGFLDTCNPKLKSLGSWFFIGIIYLSFKMMKINHTSLFFSFLIYIVTCTSCAIALIIKEEKPIALKFSLNFQFEDIIEYLKYFLPVAVTLVLWSFFNIKKPEWLIWSSITVTHMDLVKTHKKIRDRFVGGVIGVMTGLVIAEIMPYNSILIYVYFIGVLLSLRVFKKYIYGFMTRCFFVVLCAYTCYPSIAKIRLINVIGGGIIGYISVFILLKIRERLKISQKMKKML